MILIPQVVPVPVVSLLVGTPTVLLDTARAALWDSRSDLRRVALTGMTITNIHATATVRVYVGVRDDGATTWPVLISKALRPGDTYTWEGRMFLNLDAEVVAYTDVASGANVTLEMEGTFDG